MAADEEEELANRPLSVDHVDGALMISFGAVHVGREALAVDQFTELSRYLGRLLAEGAISGFRPYFFADGRADRMPPDHVVRADLPVRNDDHLYYGKDASGAFARG